VYDIFNAFHAGIEPWHETYERVKSRIAYCHLKDGRKTADGKVTYTLPGEGVLPIRDLLARFRRDGYAGYFSFEWEKKWHPDLAPPEDAFPRYVEAVRRLWG
jgi:sugar phosphate isomerase/epimerase